MNLAKNLPGQPRSPEDMATLVAEIFDPLANTPNAIDPEYWFDKLDAVGAPAVCEMIARGSLIADVALYLKVPLTVFAEWCENNIGATEMNRALRMHAQVCVMKGRLLLSTLGLTPAERDQAKVLAERLFTHAERIDRMGWAPSVKETSTPAAVMVNVNIPGYGQGPVIDHTSSVVEISAETPQVSTSGVIPAMPNVMPLGALLPTQGRRSYARS